MTHVVTICFPLGGRFRIERTINTDRDILGWRIPVCINCINFRLYFVDICFKNPPPGASVIRRLKQAPPLWLSDFTSGRARQVHPG